MVDLEEEASVQVDVELDEEDLAWCILEADRLGVSLDQFFNSILRDQLEKEKD